MNYLGKDELCFETLATVLQLDLNKCIWKRIKRDWIGLFVTRESWWLWQTVLRLNPHKKNVLRNCDGVVNNILHDVLFWKEKKVPIAVMVIYVLDLDADFPILFLLPCFATMISFSYTWLFSYVQHRHHDYDDHVSRLFIISYSLQC